MSQFSALFYKNWILYKRSAFCNCCEIFIPIIFILFVVLVRRLAPITPFAQQQFYQNTTYTFNLYGSPTLSTAQSTPTRLKPCPQNSKVAIFPITDTLYTPLSAALSPLYSLQSYADEAALEAYIRSPAYSAGAKICFAVVLNSQPNNFQYKLRFNISNQVPQTDGPTTNTATTLAVANNLPLYLRVMQRGMAATSNLINTLIFQQQTSTSDVLLTETAPIYQEQYTDDPIYTFLSNSFGILTLLPILLVYLRQTAAMLGEKEKKIRESMSIMGMSLKAYYGTWFIRYLAVMWASHAICSVIIMTQLKTVPFYIPFVVFALFDILLIIQNFFIMVFFTRAKIGVVMALLFFILQYVVSYISNNTPTESFNNSLSVIPHTAFILAFQNILYAASIQVTPTFALILNNYAIQTALLSFFLNILFYLMLLWYVEQVVPNEWGAKKHPLFCCMRSEQVHPSQVLDKNEDVESVNEKNKADETEHKALRIQSLCKEYDEVKAVQDLSLTMFKDQIFVLLGHNGAGKTTTISMLTGMTEPTRGAIEVCGETELSRIREMIGVCPQHDTLYDELTVKEHLELYATFKGDGTIDNLIHDVNLDEKSDEYAMNLSGGQKRRLSVAIAFVGGSKVIVLDEPTSGMDTSARRYIWQLLKNYKNDRIILLTTHFMDEADYLGDRIAIMAKGKLQCCGSSVYLKNKFGVGYTITFVKQERADSKDIIALVTKHIPNCKVLSDVSAELALQLPLQQVSLFPKLFDEIDARKQQLRVLEYGISITTLEEVFLKVAEKAEHGDQPNLQTAIVETSGVMMPQTQKLSLDETHHIVIPHEEQLQRENNCCVVGTRHFLATMLKRLRVILRDVKSFLFELILPLVIILFALFLMNVSFITDFPSQTLNLALNAADNAPVSTPIGSTDPTLRASVGAALTAKYGASISVLPDTTNTDPTSFDRLFLFPAKTSTLRGGIFFYPTQTIGSTPVHKFVLLPNTRTPTSSLFLPTLATEALLNSLSRPTTITLVNSPLPRSYDQLQINNTNSAFFGSFIFTIALAFKFASVVAFIVKEREDRCKHQQIVSGMRLSSYWFANYFYDYMLYAVIALITMGMITGFKVVAFTTGEALGATWLLFMFYGLANIPFTYLLSYLFKDYGNSQAAVYFINFILGSLLPILTLLLRILGTDSAPVGRGIAWFLRIFPAFSFGEGLINIGSVNLFTGTENNGVVMGALAPEIALAPILYLAVFSLLYTIGVFAVEAAQNSEAFMRLFTSENQYIDSTPPTDADVVLEAERALAANPADHTILTKHLRKVYRLNSEQEYKVAVDDLSFCVEKGQVFGLLGVNGAGKTTTFKMLAGEITSTDGQSYFSGRRISDNVDKVRKSLGYCPQFDALIESLTVKEQLELYYDLKSLPNSQKEAMVRAKMEELDLLQYEDKLSGSLSGGNKRKLSVGMALIGNPQILFLDEPSTGMDPKARRFMWKIISRIATQSKQSTVILTTHSMEEAQALSTRLAIMVKGRFQCIGTPQHVKTKYGQGYEVQVKLKAVPKQAVEAIIATLKGKRTIFKRELEALLDALKAQSLDRVEISPKGSASYLYSALSETNAQPIYPIVEFVEINRRVRRTVSVLSAEVGESVLLESLQNFLRMQTKLKVSVGKCFEFMEQNKDKLEIQQYTIKQATVQQIFNRFAEAGEMSENR